MARALVSTSSFFAIHKAADLVEVLVVAAMGAKTRAAGASARMRADTDSILIFKVIVIVVFIDMAPIKVTCMHISASKKAAAVTALIYTMKL